MTKSYTGPERRKEQRRIANSDRREMVRYELSKTPRRSGKERRTMYNWDALPKSNLM